MLSIIKHEVLSFLACNGQTIFIRLFQPFSHLTSGLGFLLKCWQIRDLVGNSEHISDFTVYNVFVYSIVTYMYV
jgi:hypothetical protein